MTWREEETKKREKLREEGRGEKGGKEKEFKVKEERETKRCNVKLTFEKKIEVNIKVNNKRG